VSGHRPFGLGGVNGSKCPIPVMSDAEPGGSWSGRYADLCTPFSTKGRVVHQYTFFGPLEPEAGGQRGRVPALYDRLVTFLSARDFRTD
jgi:hypothetical protein